MAETSHTTTAAWQSFEVRMRRRRADRCMVRVDRALHAGDLEDAREALEEAQRLDPGRPGIDELERRVAQTATVDEAVAPSRLRLVMACAVSMILVIAAVAVWRAISVAPRPLAAVAMRDGNPSSPPTTAGPESAAAPPNPSVVSIPNDMQRIDTVPPRPGAVAQPVNAEAAVPEPIEPRRPADVPELPASGRDVADLSGQVGSLVPVTAPPIPLPQVSDGGRVREEPVSSGSIPEAAPPVPDLPAIVAAERAPAEPATRDDPALIRRVLARYESAYSGLDVAGAQSVWPSVNERTLARAFDGLASQRLSLGRCQIVVNGQAARANCSGRASWKTKVGGSTGTEERRWTFELRNTEGTWTILRAETTAGR